MNNIIGTQVVLLHFLKNCEINIYFLKFKIYLFLIKLERFYIVNFLKIILRLSRGVEYTSCQGKSLLCIFL